MVALKALALGLWLIASAASGAGANRAGRPNLRARVGDTRPWKREIAEASARFGIPASWIKRVIQVESGGHAMLGGRPITSSAGAMGLMQLMPGTWAEMRLAHRLGADPYAPRDNILAGSAYLRAMYDRFGYPGLFAAYNAGPQRYAEHLATGRRLPSETLAYISLVAPVRRNASPSGNKQEAGIFVRIAAQAPRSSTELAPEVERGAIFARLSTSTSEQVGP